MEEPPAKETPEQGFNKIDLSQLQDFRFGTQWTEIKPATGPRRSAGQQGERDRGDRRFGRRADEEPSRGAHGGEEHRDRRGFRRPAGPASADQAPDRDRRRPDRPAREFRPDRPPPGQPAPQGEERGIREPRGGGPRYHRDHRPYQSPWFNVVCYPEDAGFLALVKTMRASCRTFELFEITRLIIGKNERFVVVVTRKPAAAAPPPAAAAAGSAATGSVADARAPAANAPSAPVEKTADRAPGSSPRPIYVAAPDGLPFETEDAAVDHVISRHLDRYFDVAVVEIDPPKGHFPLVNRCTLTGELLGPSNYHRYQEIVQQHHAAHFPHMPFERFRERIEAVRDPAVVGQWLEKMKKVTRYTWKLGAEGDPPLTADSLDDACALLLTKAKGKVVKAVESARFHGKSLETLPPGEIRRAIEGHLDRQRRFPLDTANALRGRLRREGFTIFKKGAKGVSYVCAVKRKFRTPAQVFADSIGALISFLEANPMIGVKQLPVKMLGITPSSFAKTSSFAKATEDGSAVAIGRRPEGAMADKSEDKPLPASNPPLPAATEPNGASAPAEAGPAAASPAPGAESAGHSLTPEQQEKLKRLWIDLRWLVGEGYVTEFADGRLFAPPPMPESRAKAAASTEEEEHDLENYPETPAEPAAKTTLPEADASPAGGAGSVADVATVEAPEVEAKPGT